MYYKIAIAGVWVMIMGGCSYQPIPVPNGEAGLPGRLGFRQLFVSPRGHVYASTNVTAKAATDCLSRDLDEIEARSGIRLARGLVIACGPGESLVSREPISQEPYLPMEPTSCLDDSTTNVILGVPGRMSGTYSWCCVLPTDEYLEESISRYLEDSDRKHPDSYFLDSNPVTKLIYRGLMRPVQSSRYLAYARAQRSLALAHAAVTSSALNDSDRQRGLTIIARVYRRQCDDAKTALEGSD
jgi:hypothetical protein